MSYHSGTITNPTTPAGDLVAAIEAVLAVTAGWTFVEVTSGISVWRNDHAEGTFYAYLRGTEGATPNFHLGLSEGYNGVAKTAIRPAPHYNQTQAVAADDSLGNGTEYTLLNGTTTGYQWINLSNATFDYWFVVTEHSLIVWARIGAATSGAALQRFESLLVTDPGRFVLFNPTSSATTSTGIGNTASTRHPQRGGQVANGANFKFYGPASATIWWTKVSGMVAGTGDLFHGGGPIGTRITVWGIGGASAYGAVRGLFRDLLAFSTDSAVAPGDLLTVNGQQYVCVTSSGVWVKA